MEQSRVVRVGLVEGHVLLREAVRALLNVGGQIEVVAEADEGADAVAMVKQQRPDVVLLVMDGNGEREFSLLSLLSDIADQTNVLVVTSHSDPALHTQAIELGARGVVMLNQPALILIKAIRKIHEGEVWLDRLSTAGVVNRLTRRRNVEEDPDVTKIESLTTREREIVTLVTEGLTNKQIAERLFISEATARNHLTSILDKLDVSDRFQLAVYAFRKGLVLCPQTPAMLRAAAAMNQDSHRSAHEAQRPTRQRSR